VPLGSNGELPEKPTVEAISLSGDYQFTAGQLNANGIAATQNGKALIIVNSVDGILYKVDPATGTAKRIDLGSGTLRDGDGILLKGNTLYVVQNSLNQIAVIELNTDFTSGTIVNTVTSPSFRVPTTIAGFGNALYAVNARFDTDSQPDTTYDVVRVPLE
jgi:DNA-binding beta-propeller fold protein YncE